MKNLPAALLNNLQDVQGFDEQPFIEAHSQAAPVSVRLHPLKLPDAFVNNETVPWCAEGRYLPERPVFTLDPLFHAGAYYVQEASSMFLDHMLRTLLPERDKLRVLDLCGAPGGKSTLIASALGSNSLLISNEVIRTRASILEENVSKWGYMNNWVTSNDPKDFGKLTGYFDVMVVDAPCSGSGLLRKDAAAVNEWSEANVALCSQRQQRILADVWPALKENGLLIYATCSYCKEEDEQILDWLKTEFEAESEEVDLYPAWGVVHTVTSMLMHGYRFFPDKVKGEGFFIAAIRKKQEEKEIQPKYKTLHNKKAAEASAYLLDGNDYLCIEQKDSFNAIMPLHEADLHLLSKAVYLRKLGLPLGQPMAKDWVPSHEIALSVNRNKNLPLLTLEKEQALRFLKKEEIQTGNITKGWYLVGFKGQTLGWIKALGNRSNNYLPKNWRIRMDITEE